MPDLPIIAPTLPEGFCPATWQELVNEAVGKAVAQFEGSGFSVIINQEAVPAVTDQDKLWRRPSQANRGLYQFSSGAWVTPHPYPLNGNVRLWWEGTDVDAWAFDGGDGSNPSISPPGTNSGAMWEVDHNYDNRFALGAIPKAIGATGGEENHVLTIAEMPAHTHTYRKGTSEPPLNTAGGPDLNMARTWDDGAATGSTGTGAAHNTMPPYRVGYWIKRTARVNYVGS